MSVIATTPPAALGLPLRNNNAQAKFGGPGGNDNGYTANIFWILVALEQQVAANLAPPVDAIVRVLKEKQKLATKKGLGRPDQTAGG
ncbi:MAG: hypothetical protein E5Y16_07245 [Mesorhizobium sp.]|nr:MAG: hypothetical protein EOS08_14755 [Mesorhizobium sp.]TJV43926.1 MAG: hypothetical protein E5Y16_07245 [Mesorhizobium sp.]